MHRRRAGGKGGSRRCRIAGVEVDLPVKRMDVHARFSVMCGERHAWWPHSRNRARMLCALAARNMAGRSSHPCRPMA